MPGAPSRYKRSAKTIRKGNYNDIEEICQTCGSRYSICRDPTRGNVEYFSAGKGYWRW